MTPAVPDRRRDPVPPHPLGGNVVAALVFAMIRIDGFDMSRDIESRAKIDAVLVGS